MTTTTVTQACDRVIADLRARRKAMGILQKQLALDLGCSQRALSGWEMRQTTPSIGTLLRWGQLLGCRIVVALS